VREDGEWRRVDANTDFLHEHSGLQVGVRLPARHFERADEAWRALQAGGPPERYAEEPYAGGEHVRRQLLQDFFSLLNHDVADVDDLRCGEETYASLAELLARDPGPAELVALYRATPDLRLESAERDAYSFVSRDVGRFASV
jgi:hypothetical protein